MGDVTRILHSFGEGNPGAKEELTSLVYEELHRLAAAKMAREADGHTLQTTALVHEAWLRLFGSGSGEFQNRAHFFGAAAEAMRRVLVDHARSKKALKHGAGAEHLELDGVNIAAEADPTSLLRINDALEKLAREDEASAELVKLRFFIGMKNEEAAAALGISESTAGRNWQFARAWLYKELRGESPR